MATILYVDQDEAAQKFVESTLGKQYNVITATDGPTAIQYCAIIQPDLVLMDLTLADIDSRKLASRLKMFMPQTPLLVIADEAETLVSSADGFLAKPLDIEKLRQSVQLLLPAPPKLSELTPASLSDDKIVQQFEAQIATLNQANQRLASINAISALISSSLDLEHLTDQILAQIHKTIAFDSATLFLLKGDILEAAAARGFSEYRRGMNTYRRSKHNSAWQVVDDKLPLIINDVRQSEFWEPRPELSKVRSWLGVPLIYKDRIVGVLTLDRNEPNAFTRADARYVFTLAYQIAIAVENAQLFEEWEKQSTRLKLINEVAREINTILDVDNLFDALAGAIFERLKYDRVAILAVDPTRSFLVLKAIYGQASPQLKPDIYQQDIKVGLVGKVARTGRSLLLHDTSQDDSFFSIEDLAVRSELIVPIFVGDQVKAVINVERDFPNGFGDQDLWTLSSLASQAATVIENAQLYRQVQAYSNKLERTVVARTQRLQAIKKISQVVSQGLAVDELLAVVGQGIGQVFTSKASDEVQVAIGLIDGVDILLKTIYRAGDKDNKQVDVSSDQDVLDADHVLRVKINPETTLGQVIDQAKPVIINDFDTQKDVQADDPFSLTQAVEMTNSVMIAPLISGGKMIGLIKVESNVSNVFDESDLETLESLTFQVASAIEHARLLQTTREIAIVEERTRLARDMHDGVAQNLAYLLIQVDRCLNMVEEGGKLEAQLERTYALLKQNIDELRRNIFDLRPVALEGKSLFEVLENFVTEFGQRWHLKTTCVVDNESPEVSPEVESTLYRIVQEALSNAQQHAQCRQLSVSLAVEDNRWITMEVKDDGLGFEMSQLDQDLDKPQSKGLGLVSMRERANTVGGHLTVESIQRQGTRVFARLPVRRELGIRI
jgi:GAF domain-containing protein